MIATARARNKRISLTSECADAMHRGMARKPIAHRLPPLDKLCPRFAGFAPHLNLTDESLRQLESIIAKVRKAEAQPFYPIRHVAAFLRVPYRSAARAYQLLEERGLLTRIRSSHTVLRGIRPQSRQPVRSIVAVPVWTPGFIAFGEWREFFRALDDELRRHGMIADPIFVDRAENLETLLDRIVSHRPDHVVWLAAVEAHEPILRSLIDAGITPTVIVSGPQRRTGTRYRLSWDDALLAMLRRWHADGIRSVSVPQPDAWTMSVCQNLDWIASRSILPITVRRPNGQELPAYLKGLSLRADEGILFDNDMWCARLEFEARASFVALLRARRSALLRKLTLWPAHVEGLIADTLEIPWRGLARRVALDLAGERAVHADEPFVIRAGWTRGRDLRQFITNEFVIGDDPATLRRQSTRRVPSGTA
jgi:hypothetical protein